MSDEIKTLREAAETLTSRCIIATTGRTGDDHRRMVQIEDALATLCRREIERMEKEAPVVSIKAITADALSAARDEGWNAAIEAAAQMALDCDTMGEDYADDELTDEGKAARRKCRQIFAEINSLRKGSSHG